MLKCDFGSVCEGGGVGVDGGLVRWKVAWKKS